MNIAVRYQSRNGNTRAAAETIANIANVEAKSIDTPLRGHIDILFVGGGVYMWDADKELINFLENLDKKQIGQIAAFSTTGTMTATIKRICEYADKRSIPVNENKLCLKMLIQGHSAFGLQGGKLKEQQIEKIRKFTEEVLKG